MSSADLDVMCDQLLQELLRRGVSRSDCQTALESVFGGSSRGRVRVNLDDLEDEDACTPTLFGIEGEVIAKLVTACHTLSPI